ncbi:uncharacterized protein LOC123559389 [Mercenaria mercenaria]|uniref:uncharacterized protein LOC123559389 n=1 Tax=Mercenaria mercenaria TaxID=6596 RepID=UPI001E1D9622|nr:uncharacterized protein LOC123559389 [Mercenaria mercenaria]
MEHFESLALSTAPHPPGWWFRYVDDTYIKQMRQYVDEFTDHINSIDPDIKFTIEKGDNGSLAFLDTNTIRLSDGHLKTIKSPGAMLQLQETETAKHPLQCPANLNHSNADLREKLFHSMYIIKATAHRLSLRKTPITAYEQPLYAIAKQIKRNRPITYDENKVLITPGGLFYNNNSMEAYLGPARQM